MLIALSWTSSASNGQNYIKIIPIIHICITNDAFGASFKRFSGNCILVIKTQALKLKLLLKSSVKINEIYGDFYFVKVEGR